MSFLNIQEQLNIQKMTEDLRWLLGRISYKPDWSFNIKNYAGDSSVFEISIKTIDSNGGAPLLINHHFPIPLKGFGYDLERWVLDCILMVEQHEACEFFKLDGIQIYLPEHGPDGHPYKIKRRY